MRKMFYCVSLLSMSVLLSSLAVAKEFPIYNAASSNGGSQCDAVGDNLVLNCGFETGSFLPYWIESGDPSFHGIGGPAHSGSNAAVMGPVDSLGFLTQTLATTADQSYTLTYWVRNDSSPNEFQVSWDGNVISDDTLGDFMPYTFVEVDGLTASADGTDLTFGYYNLPAFIYHDDIVVN